MNDKLKPDWLTIARKHGYSFPDARMQNFVGELLAARPVADAGDAVAWLCESPFGGTCIAMNDQPDNKIDKVTPLYRAAPSARTMSEAQAANLDLVIARLEQIAGNFTDDYRNGAAEALVCARAIAATSAPAEAPSDAWAGSVQQVICDLPLPQGSEKERQRLVEAKALILDAIRALQCRPEAPICTCPSGTGSLAWPCPAHPPTEAPQLDPVVEANRALLLKRSQFGIKKYGVTLGDARYSHRELMTHALEEVLDLANYIQADLQRELGKSEAPKGGI